MVTNDRRVKTYSDYIQRFTDNPRVWIDEDLNEKNSGQYGNWIDRVIHPDATSQKGADAVGIAETKSKKHGSFGPIEVCSFVKTTSKEKGLEEAYEKLKDGLGLVTYEVSKGTHTHNHPILGEMSMEKDCLDLVQLFLYKKCIKKVFMASAVIISKSDTSYKVQIPNRDIHKCFEDAVVINIKKT